MPVTFDEPGLQAQLQTVINDITANDFAQARLDLVQAGLILLGIPQTRQIGQAMTAMRAQYNDLTALLKEAQIQHNAKNFRRLIKTGLWHGRTTGQTSASLGAGNLGTDSAFS